MANRTGSGQSIPQLNRSIGALDQFGDATFPRSAPVARGAGQAASEFAVHLNSLIKSLEDRQDRIARQEGIDTGTVQGMQRDVLLRKDGTIRGEAFDAAAVRSMVARYDMESRQEGERIFEQNKYNPKSLKNALDAYRNGVMSSNLPALVKQEFETSFSRASDSYVNTAKRAVSARQKDEDRTLAIQAMDMRRRTIEKLALRADSDEKAGYALEDEINSMESFLLQYGPQEAFEFNGKSYDADSNRAGVYDLESVQKILLQIKDDAMEKRVLGKFMQMDDRFAKQNYLQALQDEFEGGQSPLTFDQFERLSRRMDQEIGRDISQSKGWLKTVDQAIAAQQKRLDAGFEPNYDMLETIYSQALEQGDLTLIDAVESSRNLLAFQDQARKWTPEQLSGWITGERAKLNDNADITDMALERLERAENLLKTMHNEIKRDGLEWGARTGLVDLKSIDFTADDVGKQIAGRLEAANTVSEYYHRPLQVLTQNEVNAFQSAFKQGSVDEKTALIAMVQESFGAAAPSVFEAMSKDNPALANIGGLLQISPAHSTTARDFIIGEGAIAEGHKVISDNGTVRAVKAEIIGTAYSLNPSAMKMVEETAERIYTAKALQRGLDHDNFDENLYKESVQQAAGGWWDQDGQRYGGILSDRGGHSLVLPPSMSEKDFLSTIKSLSDADLQLGSVGDIAPTYQSGEKMKAKDLRRFFLISSGPGRYVVSTTNPVRAAPVFLIGGNAQGLYEIDINQLQSARRHIR